MIERMLDQGLYVSTGLTKAKSNEIINEQLNDQVKENTVVIDIDLLLKQAMPRNTYVADRAMQIHNQVCNSGHLTPQPGHLTNLMSGIILDEKAVYPEIQYLFDVCARAVYDSMRVLNPNDPVRREARLLQSPNGFDYAPIGADNNKRPDIAIAAREVPTNGYPALPFVAFWRDIAAVVEVKRVVALNTTRSEPSQVILDKTCGQLARYVLNMSTTQPNRRFTWSVFIIHTYAYMCLFGRDRIYRAKAIDLSTLAGRELFTQFVVYWSLAGSAQFGLDPTIYYNYELDCWVIECFDDTDSTPIKYWYYAKDTTVFIRPSLFGRRTVSFSVSEKPGGKATLFIKDAWAVSTLGAAGQDPRSEITLLHLIDEHFSKHSPGVPYPKLVHGGSVWQAGYRCWEPDDTHLAYGVIDVALHLPGTNSPSPVYRVHRRMVMTPLAQRLDTLDNFNDLIKVLTDVMVCHRKLYEGCGLFHRDISTNNIMVVRHGSAVRGMLVDFDNAIPLSLKISSGRPERTGTLPFMSIGNLENNDTERTALDDWESLLYLICWVGTYGFKPESYAKSTDSAVPKPKLHRWLEGSMEDVASEKRSKMDSIGNFNLIMKSFLDLTGVRLLKKLALNLYFALFQYHECPGAVPVDGYILELRQLTANSGCSYDPLKARADYQGDIVNNCHKALQAAYGELDQPREKKPRI
ncbi:hypothetical protein H4R35_006189 [Dimargaris xerosporica]|nr:hypothetical protein H4R35_006189 [Dimargaris xerosporica]